MTGQASPAPREPDFRPLFNRARFLLGAMSPAQIPADSGAEVAFAGRSNAGKSSALNRLCDQRGLARTSKQPGRTQQINFFALDDGAALRLVDLPGYGFAKVPLAQRRDWERLIGRYLEARRSLRGLVLVMDIRHPLKDSDRMLLDWALDRGVPVHCVLTKADKLKRGAMMRAVRGLEAALEGSGADVQAFSATAGTGVETLRRRVGGWLTGDGTPGGRAKKSPTR
jgi:GTP-binding protein